MSRRLLQVIAAGRAAAAKRTAYDTPADALNDSTPTTRQAKPPRLSWVSTVLYSSLQFSTVLYGSLRFSTVLYGSLQFSTI